jgi:hypothetical protein
VVKNFAQFALIVLYTIVIGIPIIAASFLDGGRTMLALGRSSDRRWSRAVTSSSTAATADEPSRACAVRRSGSAQESA